MGWWLRGSLGVRREAIQLVGHLESRRAVWIRVWGVCHVLRDGAGVFAVRAAGVAGSRQEETAGTAAASAAVQQRRWYDWAKLATGLIYFFGGEGDGHSNVDGNGGCCKASAGGA